MYVWQISKATATEICAPKDMQGKHSNRPLVKFATDKKQIENTTRLVDVITYLSSQLSIAEMHVDKCEHAAENPAVSYACYAKVFNTKFNLGFGQP